MTPAAPACYSFYVVPNRSRAQAARLPEYPDSLAAPTLLAKKQELVRNTIWDAAIDLFAERGFDQTTVDDIAEAAGVSQRSFFRYFVSKADLMGKGSLDYALVMSKAIRACPQTHSLSEVMRGAIVDVLLQASAYPRIEKVIQVAEKYPAANQARLSRMAEVQKQLSEAYADRMKHVKKNDFTPELLAALTTSLFDVALHTWFRRGRRDIRVTVDEVFERTRDVLEVP